ncbi:ribosomal protein L7/L12 [Croceibacterium aestuarii]|uniref:ribosomal protein L7/L12 n=1 Tax=Croceibacterium aestuarii TaxID=3064139 RepID=UPI00272E8A8C|nr:ribosomal protein L7/L12 [Croceibacterium sp. D39]
MFVPLWILVPAALLLLVLLARALSGGSRDMIERQRAATFEPGSDHLTVLAQPEVQEALRAKRKIEAIKLVRERTGLGLKEAKLLVERQAPR